MTAAPFHIASDRLLIRPWQATDQAGFRQMVSDPEMMRYISNGLPWSDERIAEFQVRQGRQLESHRCCMGALEERSTGRLVGVCGLQPLGTTSDTEIGWWVVRDRWGEGLATEAAGAALRYAWDALALHRVVAIALPQNLASTRIMEKLGMRCERHTTTQDLGKPGPPVEVVLYAIERAAP